MQTEHWDNAIRTCSVCIQICLSVFEKCYFDLAGWVPILIPYTFEVSRLLVRDWTDSLLQKATSIYWRSFAHRSINFGGLNIYSRLPQALENILGFSYGFTYKHQIVLKVQV